MTPRPLPIPGCFEIEGKVVSDARGRFVKTYVASRFAEWGLRTDWREEYYSVSRQGVIRGMHFQEPPCAHDKLVCCIAGEVLDVLLDLRQGSPTQGRAISLRLSAAAGNSVYLPAGVAHGFLAVSPEAILHYKVTSEYSPGHDKGIRWDSFGFDWPVDAPVLSERDSCHVPLAAYASPFVFGERA